MTQWFQLVLFSVICVTIEAEGAKLKLRAKEIARGKVHGEGYSVQSTSLEQCLALCNKRKETCDGIVFHEIIGKCRLISKCAQTFQVNNSTDFVYYSKRPQIRSPGYIHDPQTDSCLKVVQHEGDYAQGDADCAQEHGHLARIDSYLINSVASEIIKETTGAGWTWIGENKMVGTDGKFHHIGNNVISEEPFQPEVTVWRNDSMKSCWAINSNGQWGQFSCKTEKFNALCQIFSFPS